MADPFRARNGSSAAAADKENPEPLSFSEQISPIHQQPLQAVGEGAAQVVAPTPAGNDPNAAERTGAAAANMRGDRAARGGNNVENGVQGNTACSSKCKECVFSNTGCIFIITILGLATLLSLSLALTYVPYDIYLKGSGDCTQYEILTPEAVLCGEGSPQRYGGVNTTVVEDTSPEAVLSASLVDRSDLKFYSQETGFMNDSGQLMDNVLFNSGDAVYTWSGSIIFGRCCVENQNDVNQTATLDIYDSYDDAGGENPVFSETITVAVGMATCFKDWSNEKPFIVEKSAYYIFELRTPGENMNYTSEISIHQRFVNASDYTNTNYFTSLNYSYFPYRGGITDRTDYVTICKAPPFLIVPGRLHVRSCPESRSLVRGLFIASISIGIVFLVAFIVAIVCYCVYWARERREKNRAPPMQAST